jgi:FKBP-type peptidyl-prolyl cis-trans isomerase FklB
MKFLTIPITLILIMSNSLTAQDLKTADDSLAYSLGVLIANNLKQEGFTKLRPELITAGLTAVINGEKPLLSMDACNTIVRENAVKQQMKQHEGNKASGEAFLAENKKRDGVVSLDNGLQYEILKEGNGKKPKATDKVLVHYHGTLIDGTTFDSSVDRGEPITFGLNQVIKGWTEILQLMPVGSKWRVYIPYHLAYGDQGAGQSIKPYSTLIFEIELLGIE